MGDLSAWEGNFQELEQHGEELVTAPELCDRVFASKHEAYLAGRYLAVKPDRPAEPRPTQD